MDTIYTIKGWVKKVTDDTYAKTLENIEMIAIGEKGKEFLTALAKEHLNTWNEVYIVNNKKYKVGIACTIFSNKVSESTGLIDRDKSVFSKLIKSRPSRNISRNK